MICLSIIVPVYKVEEYVGQCLESIFKGGADESQYEVVVVNDGTPDRSMDVVHEVCAGHGNVKIVEQENQGLSAARMAGLAQAEGEYVWFVDSDDWLAEGAIGLIIKKIASFLDAEAFSFPLLWCSDNKKWLDYTHSDGALSTKEYFESSCLIFGAQRYVVKSQLFVNQHLRFPKGLLHEDIYYCYVLLYLAKTIHIINDVKYYYRVREGSIMTSLSERNLNDMLANYKLLKGFQKEDVIKTDQSWFMLSAFCNVLSQCYEYAYEMGQTVLDRFAQNNRCFVIKEYLLYYRKTSIKRFFGDVFFLLSPLKYIRIKKDSRIIR